MFKNHIQYTAAAAATAITTTSAKTTVKKNYRICMSTEISALLISIGDYKWKCPCVD